MDLMNAIKARKSIRAFQSKSVDKSVIEELLQAAIMAPSGSNAQPWKFFVVTGQCKKELDALLVRCVEEGLDITKRQTDIDANLGRRTGTNKTAFNILFAKFYQEKSLTLEGAVQSLLRHYEAPVAIFITLDYSVRINILAAGAAIENILLAACDKGLGTCWLTFPYHRTKSAPRIIKKHLNIPASEKIVSSIALGYPDTEAPINAFKAPRNEFNSFVEWFGWD